MSEVNFERPSMLEVFNLGRTHKRSFFIVILLILFYTCTGKYVNNYKFDYLLLSQRWLPSACIEYIEKGGSSSNSNFCILSDNFKRWSIHGLWPTQNHSMGPFFCNRSLPFDIHKIEPIQSELELEWPNIEGGKTVASLWQHEWEKHGTCAAQLESLNTEIKYFNVTLSLKKKYNVQALFTKNNINPSKNGVSLLTIFFTIRKAYGKVPQVHCIKEVKTHQPYLSEIRLCYNKELELIDCGSMHKNRLNNNRTSLRDLTNCPMDGNIIIPDNINPTSHSESTLKNSEGLDYYNKLYGALLFIRFLQWASI